jgi:hypothetical protein
MPESPVPASLTQAFKAPRPPATISLPLWQECSRKRDALTDLTELESFIYDNEPAGDDSGWRGHLAPALAEVVGDDRRSRATDSDA